MVKMKTFITALSVLWVSLGFADPQDADTRYWEWRGANEAGAWLQTEQENDVVRFSLEVNRGGPSFNSGAVSGEFYLRHHIGIFRTEELPECTLVFAFVGDAVQIEQLGRDYTCGFGFGVVARHLLNPATANEQPTLGAP